VLPSAFSKEEIEEFKNEALELLEVAEKSLLDLDTGGEFKITFDNVFRATYSSSKQIQKPLKRKSQFPATPVLSIEFL